MGRAAITGFCWGGRIVWLYAAHSAGLKAGDVETAISGNNPSIEARLTRDAELAEDLNATGTPAFFISVFAVCRKQ